MEEGDGGCATDTDEDDSDVSYEPIPRVIGGALHVEEVREEATALCHEGEEGCNPEGEADLIAGRKAREDSGEERIEWEDNLHHDKRPTDREDFV